VCYDGECAPSTELIYNATVEEFHDGLGNCPENYDIEWEGIDLEDLRPYYKAWSGDLKLYQSSTLSYCAPTYGDNWLEESWLYDPGLSLQVEVWDSVTGYQIDIFEYYADPYELSDGIIGIGGGHYNRMYISLEPISYR